MILDDDPSGPDALFVIYSRVPGLLERSYALESFPAVVTVGRHAENSIVLDSDGVSRRHARFEKRADGWWVVDNESTNGTFVNQEQVKAALLRRGDHVSVGGTIFKLVSAAYCAEYDRRAREGRYTATPIDGLTKVYNRRYLIEQIDRELQSEGRPGRPLTLVMFDLDQFKRCNDTHGHLAGDRVLQDVASLMRERARPGDVVARYGGEEFALLLPGTDLGVAAALAEVIRAEVAAHVFTFEERTISMTISAGAAQASEDIRVAEDLINAADQKLYAAKRGGRNRVLS